MVRKRYAQRTDTIKETTTIRVSAMDLVYLRRRSRIDGLSVNATISQIISEYVLKLRDEERQAKAAKEKRPKS
jgi:hypothetical protein